jgi:hypothetical protein
MADEAMAIPDMLKKLSVVAGIELPGQAIVVAAIEAGTSYRQTMNQANRDEEDRMNIAMKRNIHNCIWLPLLEAVGLKGMEKI